MSINARRRGILNQPYSPFTKVTADLLNTDFRHHTVGPNPYDFVLSKDSNASYQITTNGFISSKCLEITSGQSGLVRSIFWNPTKSVATDNQEILMLVEPLNRIQISAATGNVGPLLKVSPSTSTGSNHIGAFLGHLSTNETRNVRYSVFNGTNEFGSGATSWAANQKWWIRLRISGFAVHGRKTWQYGDNEPAFSTFTFSNTSSWPTVAGKAGLLLGPVGQQNRIHWISVAYNGATAEFPP